MNIDLVAVQFPCNVRNSAYISRYDSLSSDETLNASVFGNSIGFSHYPIVSSIASSLRLYTIRPKFD